MDNGEPSFELGADGEPGIETKKRASSDEIASELMEKVVPELELNSLDEVVVMVNGMGATPEMELYVFNRKVQEILAEQGVNVSRTFVGEYMTSLEMAGCSITLLKVDSEMKEWLHAPSKAPSFRV